MSKEVHDGANHQGYSPAFVTVERTFKFSEGSIVVIDEVYNDYALYRSLTNYGTCFVTRLKINAIHRVVNRRLALKSKGLV
jgi:hypothetical protein